MSDVSGLAKGVGQFTASRFAIVGYLPSYAAVLYVTALLAARTRTGRIDPGRALDRLHGLSAAELAVLAVIALLVAAFLQPLQLPLVRLLEGYWPRGTSALARIAVKGQERARRRLALDAEVPPDPTDAERQRALVAAWQLGRRYPPGPVPLLPTALGNALRAGEASAGSAYGADAVPWWPRLYPVLGDRMRAVVDDRRNQLDLACRLSVTAGFTGLLSVILLIRSGWWLTSAGVLLALAWVAYRGAVSAALGYAEALSAAFDLHRFDVLTALHLQLPADPAAEETLNRRLSRFWSQGVPLTGVPYVHEPAAPGEDAD
ncbi:hypothetical protein QZH56_35325 [Streptomyces olivoreticuli]|uniref:hypothetical protein n=1 Tax=Streptomyces olivoreticuli TaxID=68246 RepID=UPI0026581E5A|nr:hypothetical protein [Streptomyces olivoreticuli]WKK23903.1 hypothetical protein QZH56_35325 [Streptomyces olivoreticuli]